MSGLVVAGRIDALHCGNSCGSFEKQKYLRGYLVRRTIDLL
jgi:hypothetical protein